MCFKVNNWFDVVNSHSESSFQPYKAPFGTDLPVQLSALKEMEIEILGMRCLQKNGKIAKTLLPFQTGILMTISSIRLMYDELKKKYGIKTMLLAKLNNDAIESVFSEIRFVNGWLKGITVLMFWAALKMIILGKDTPALKQNVNSRDRFTATGQMTCRLLEELKPTQNAEIQLEIDDPIGGAKDGDAINENDFSVLESCKEFLLVEEDGLEYFAGYVAQRLRESFPELSEPANSDQVSEPLSYVQLLSKGNLFVPSTSWITDAGILENVFLESAPEIFKQKIFPIQRLAAAGEAKMKNLNKTLDPKIILSFMTYRFYLRIDSINELQAALKVERRRANKLRRITGDKGYGKK